jgi:hypothetical protein
MFMTGDRSAGVAGGVIGPQVTQILVEIAREFGAPRRIGAGKVLPLSAKIRDRKEALQKNL